MILKNHAHRFVLLAYGLMIVVLIGLPAWSHAQLNENCTVSVLNRTVKVKPDGSWVLPNVPSSIGQVRARVVCTENGLTRAGQSDFFTIPTDGSVDVPEIPLGAFAPIPDSLSLTAPSIVLTQPGITTQLLVTATFGDGSSSEVTGSSAGTNYTVSNPAVATVSPEGLVTALVSGAVVVTAMNEGAIGFLRIEVVLSGDSDGDGIPDDTELANGLNPNNPVDALEDFDNDGLTNQEEIVDFGTDIRMADSDNDGFNDGVEVVAGTNPNDQNEAPYDDFASVKIDRTKWANGEIVRRLNNGLFESALARVGLGDSEILNVVDPNSANAMEVTVAVTEAMSTDALTMAGLFGAFYNDGDPGGGAAGDVVAGVGILHDGTGLVGALLVGRCDDPDCDSFTIGLFDTTTIGSVAVGETHTLSISWDGTEFTFGFNAQVETFNPTLQAPNNGPPGDPFKGPGTIVDEITTAEGGGFIRAVFDNMRVNGLLYDDFQDMVLNPVKWENLEFVRQNANGMFESVVTAFDEEVDGRLDFIAPNVVDSFRADITVTDVTNLGATPVAQVVGSFYNDVASGVGAVGDIVAGVGIGHNGTALTGVMYVSRCEDADCNVVSLLFFDDTTFGAVTVGEAHRISLAWDGTIFTFSFDEQIMVFDPTIQSPFMRPTRFPYKGLGNLIAGFTGPGTGASLSATYDNVVVQ